MRPNIRVEIQNNLVESMEVDENEEGEISDDEKGTSEEHLVELKPSEAASKTFKSAFMTGVDVQKEQDKLQVRAKRFCLNPEEIKNFRDEDLQLLQNSLGITPLNEANVRFEVIHMRGIEQMNAGDILDYFLEFAPVSVEWIDEESCNVAWSDKITTARALHFMSKPVRGMPVRDDTSYFDNLHEGDETDQSILVINRNREVHLQEEPEETAPNKLIDVKNSVDISEITTTIPPGYWRLGNKTPNSKCLLLRFSLITDKKHFKIEQFSRYYKTQGKKKVNVSRSAKQVVQGIFGRNKDMHAGSGHENPWSVLAKNWDEDSQFREKDRTLETDEPKVEVKNHSLRVRLGSKRKDIGSDSEKPEQPKKVKIPRMRMYADEEEEKIKRKQMLKRINHQIKKIEEDTSTNSDLRTVLNMTNRTHGVKLEKAEPEVFDLGTRLKNRNKKMVFEIKTEGGEHKESKEYHHANVSRERSSLRDRVHRRKYSNSDDEDFNYYKRGDHDHKPKSKVAVVIKTQKKPAVASAVASTVWSRVSSKSNNSESESESESSNSENSSEESETEEVEEFVEKKISGRPGFTTRFREQTLTQTNYKSPLKIEINNDHFKRT